MLKPHCQRQSVFELLFWLCAATPCTPCQLAHEKKKIVYKLTKNDPSFLSATSVVVIFSIIEYLWLVVWNTSWLPLGRILWCYSRRSGLSLWVKCLLSLNGKQLQMLSGNQATEACYYYYLYVCLSPYWAAKESGFTEFELMNMQMSIPEISIYV